MRKTTFVLVICCLVLGFSYAGGQDEQTEPVRPSVDRVPSQSKMVLLQETLRILREEKQELYEMRRAWKQEKQDIQNQLKSLKLRIEHGSWDLETVQDKNAQLSRKLEQTRQKIKDWDKKSMNLWASLLAESVVLKQLVKQSVPWQSDERGSQLEAIEAGLQKNGNGLIDILRKLWDVFSQESALTRLCEVGSIKIKTETGEKEMDAIRLGRLLVLYQSEDRQEAGMLYQDAKGKVVNIKVSGTLQAGIHNAILVLKKRKSPALVTVPLPLAVHKKRYPAEDAPKINRGKEKTEDDE